jgi:hypothetical protein
MGSLYPTLPIAGVLACFTLFGAHALRMRTEKNYREMWGSATLSLLPAAIFWFLVFSGEPDLLKRTMLLIPAGALVGACLFAYAGYFFHDITAAHAESLPASFKEAQLMPTDRGPIINQNVTSYGQQGGITAHTVNVGPQPRNLETTWGAPLKAQILSQLPRDKEITVLALMGDAETSNLALQIHAFLKANGFKLKEDGISHGMFTVPPHGLNFNPQDSTFIVGANLP